MCSDQVGAAVTTKKGGPGWHALFLGVMCMGLAAEVILLVQRNRRLSGDLDRAVTELFRADIPGGSSSNPGAECLGDKPAGP